MPAPAVSGAIWDLQRGQLLDLGVDDRPDVDPDVVHVEPGARGTAGGPDAADRLQAVRDRPLGVGQGDHPSLVVADDGELADLGQGDEPLVGGVSWRDAPVEQHVLRRIEARDVELAQPTKGEPAADHRVHATDQDVLDQVVPPSWVRSDRLGSGRKVK